MSLPSSTLPAPLLPPPAFPPAADVLRRLPATHRVDFAYLDRVAGGDATYVVLMARLFCAHFPEHLLLAEIAAARADGPALRQALSRLAVACQLLGLPRLVALAHQIGSGSGNPATATTPATWAGLRALRKGGAAAMRTLADELCARYPHALAALGSLPPPA